MRWTVSSARPRRRSSGGCRACCSSPTLWAEDIALRENSARAPRQAGTARDQAAREPTCDLGVRILAGSTRHAVTALQAGGRGFESHQLHQRLLIQTPDLVVAGLGADEGEFGFELGLAGVSCVGRRQSAACPVLRRGCLHLVGQQDGERFGEFGGDVEVVVDEQTLEERLVELATEPFGRFEVCGFAVLNE